MNLKELKVIRDNRLIYPDVLRAAATIAVIVLHVCGGMMWALTTEMYQFKWIVSADTIVRCAVPLFLMLSGMFLISPKKDISLNDLFKKYIKRLLFAYFGWSAFYAVFTIVTQGLLYENTFKTFWKLFFDGHYHLWFIPMMIGVYLTTPFFRGIAEHNDDNLLTYTLLILILFGVIYPAIKNTLPSIYSLLARINPSLFGIYATYYFAGYYFSRVEVKKLNKLLWTIILPVSAVWFVWSVYNGSMQLGALDETQWAPNQIALFLYTISVFLFFRNYGDYIVAFPRIHKFIQIIAELSFYIYLVHDVFIRILAYAGYNALTWHPIISVPLLSVTVLILSMIVSDIISRAKLFFQ